LPWSGVHLGLLTGCEHIRVSWGTEQFAFDGEVGVDDVGLAALLSPSIWPAPDPTEYFGDGTLPLFPRFIAHDSVSIGNDDQFCRVDIALTVEFAIPIADAMSLCAMPLAII
jgi:hypothetical protein